MSDFDDGGILEPGVQSLFKIYRYLVSVPDVSPGNEVVTGPVSRCESRGTFSRTLEEGPCRIRETCRNPEPSVSEPSFFDLVGVSLPDPTPTKDDFSPMFVNILFVPFPCTCLK